MTPRLRILFLALLCSVQVAAQAATPSFLCSKAKSWTEKTICGSNRLSELDLELARAYARLLRTTMGEQQQVLTRTQTKWWGSREECRKAADPTGCLSERYVARIAALKNDPSYSELHQTTVRLPPERLAIVGQGWTKALGRYRKPIRACLERAKEPIEAITVVWERDDGQTLGMRMRSSANFQMVCVVQRDGSQVLELHDTNEFDSVPAEGPIFYPDRHVPPASACGKPVQVLDELDAPSGWLGPSCAPQVARPAEAQALRDHEAAPRDGSELP